MAETAKDRSAYQRDYYEKRKEELSQQRKQKYRSDPESRQKAIAASRAYRAKKKQLRALKKDENGASIGNRRHRVPTMIIVGDIKVQGHTITTLAQRIERSKDTINNWINNGTIPKTPYHSERGDRLYSDGMIIIIKIAIHARSVVRKDSGVRDEILSGWKELGVAI